MNSWYFAKDGRQEGPMTAPQIAALVKAGSLDPATTLVWREGLSDWKTLGESGVLAEIEMGAVAVPNPASANPYLVSERTRNSVAQARSDAPLEYPGYGRLRYFITIFLFMIVFYAVLFAVIFAMFGTGSRGPGGGLAAVMSVIVLLMLGGSVYIALQRLRNLGMSGWSMLWTLVPFINLWIGWRMIACPAGYEQHRTLDTPAKVITAVWIGSLVLGVAANIISAVAQR